jgi:hypothetical protein
MADKHEDGNTRKWDELKAMRERRDGHEPTPVKVIDPPAPAAVAATPAAAAPATPETPARDPETGKFVKAAEGVPAAPAVPVTPEQPAAAAPAAAPVVTDPQADTVEVEIDGQKVRVAPEIAAAFTEAEKVIKDTAAETREFEARAKMREEITKEVLAKLPAQTAADKALAEAEAEASLPPKPDKDLLLTDPSKYAEQLDAHNEARIELATKKAKSEVLAEVNKNAAVHRASQEEAARAVVRERFYQQYPQFKGSEEVVNSVLNEQMDDVQKRYEAGTWKAPTTDAERQAITKQEFAVVASKAARKIIGISQTAKRLAPPVAAATPPPTLVASAPAHAPAPKAPEAPAKPEDKFPKGSMSAALAARKASRDRASA